MARTPLYDVLASAGGRMGEYGGAETAAAFGEVAQEFEALRSGCGVYDLDWRAKLIATGPDRMRWMNGMVTNNVKDLPLNRGVYNFLLNAQGRIQGDLYIYNRGDYLLIDTDASQSEKLREIFEKYIIMDDVEISDAREKLSAIGVQGPQSAELLKRAGIDIGTLQELEVRDMAANEIGISLVRGPASRGAHYEIWLAPQDAGAIWKLLTGSGAKPVGFESLEMARIACGVPRYGQDIRERDLPQESEQQQALNFEKGCYVGQEIVERIHSRGNIHRKFTGFEFAGAPPAPGAKIQTSGKEIGEITSVASLPGMNGRPHVVGLGYIRREAATSGSQVTAGETEVKIAELPFKGL